MIIIKLHNYGTRRCNSEFKRTLQQSPFWAESTQFLVLISISLRSILILPPSTSRVFWKSPSFKILKAILFSSILATWSAHLNILDGTLLLASVLTSNSSIRFATSESSSYSIVVTRLGWRRWKRNPVVKLEKCPESNMHSHRP